MRLKKAEREFVAYQRVCRVATVSRDGRPHNVPVCPILEGDRIYFASAADGVKVQNVRATGQVALAYDEYTEAWPGLKGILIWGTGRVSRPARHSGGSESFSTGASPNTNPTRPWRKNSRSLSR